MNSEVKAKWIGALRSGKYKQGRRVLRTEHDEYCCLGVLCEVYAEHHPDQHPTLENLDVGWGPLSAHWAARPFNGCMIYLPQEVYEWAALEESNPKCQGSNGFGGRATLAELNDAGATFEKIAEVIEREF